MRKPPLSASVATLLCIVLLCGLGAWQIQRLHWKQGLLAKMDAAYAEKNPPLIAYPDIARAGAGDDFAAVRLQGTFRTGNELLLGVRTWQGQPGYHALAVLAMPGGGMVLVNRGWVPAAMTGKTQPPSSPAGPVTVTGILHKPVRDNPFVPQNDPAAGLWYRWDLPAMARTAGVTALAPLVLYETGESAGDPAFPVRAALHWDLPNNHLYYAAFWFTMAGVLAVIFYLRFLKNL